MVKSHSRRVQMGSTTADSRPGDTGPDWRKTAFSPRLAPRDTPRKGSFQGCSCRKIFSRARQSFNRIRHRHLWRALMWQPLPTLGGEIGLSTRPESLEIAPLHEYPTALPHSVTNYSEAYSCTYAMCFRRATGCRLIRRPGPNPTPRVRACCAQTISGLTTATGSRPCVQRGKRSEASSRPCCRREKRSR